MGQPLYAYQAPTGFPDRAEAWVNTGSLLNRMNFGLQLAANRVKGVSLDLPALNAGREPASREEGLRTYAALLMPGRDLSCYPEAPHPHGRGPQPRASGWIRPRPGTPARPRRRAIRMRISSMLARRWRRGRRRPSRSASRLGHEPKEPVDRHAPTPLEQVVGVILGSPEFQRR